MAQQLGLQIDRLCSTIEQRSVATASSQANEGYGPYNVTPRTRRARDIPRRSINERDVPESVADPKPESEHNTHAEAINTHTEINNMTGDSSHHT